MSLYHMSGITAQLEGSQNKTLSPIVDINFQGEYAITDDINAFIQLKNLSSQNYERFYRYQSRGIEVLAGGIFLF